MTFGPGDTVKQISVTIIPDVIVETDEVFTLSLSTSAGSPLTVGTPGSTQIIIDDNDGMQSLNKVYFRSSLGHIIYTAPWSCMYTVPVLLMMVHERKLVTAMYIS